MVKYYDVNAQGHSIRCKLFCDKERDVKRVVVFGHGFGGHKDNKAAERFALKALSKYKNLGILVFDLPCHGGDVKKKLTLADCDSYITLILEHIREHFGTEDICVYATSFGGYLILKYIHEHGNPFRRIALRCPAVNMHESMTQRIMTSGDAEKLAKGKEADVGFDRKIRISQSFLDGLKEADIQTWDFLDYAEDILILHGTKDEVIPFEAAQAFADNSLIEFLPIEKADHRFQDPKIMDLAIKHILDFLEL